MSNVQTKIRATIKIIGLLIGALITILVIGLFCTYWWLSIKWVDFYTEKEMLEMASLVNKSQTLPYNFYQAYDKIYPNQRGKTLSKMTFEIIWGLLADNIEILGGKQCNCISATYEFNSKIPISYHSWAGYVTAHGLEKYATEEKCFDFNYGKMDLQKYANRYFEKPFDQLTYNENLSY